ncbi:SDR family oxidoreductase [Poritiphilus flavus]|uniref:SDR family oxidoreductase n=1 Tax=Poritiphilus flavus TaxID=2697053 RepID=A0A6L9EH38_9FLAO|nr:SDR family oxidoreductase [Poritiphilus flavus]NAS13966.1 SDR family oxidoreductase [Poritiphilus flavus]
MEKSAMSRRVAIKNTGKAAAVFGAGLVPGVSLKQNSAVFSENELKGKVAIVTGARNNLGRGYAVAFGAAGANVVVHHHKPDSRDQAEETASLVEKAGGKAAIAVGDLGQLSNIEKLFDTAIDQFGRVDILVNNAGQIVKKPLSEVTEEEYDRLANINSKGTFFCMREASRRLADNGRIINIGTTLFGKLTPNYSAYAGTKAGMEEYARALAREVGGRGITVNVVCPGPIDTPFFHSQEPPGAAAYVAKFSVAQRIGEISDVVPLVSFLASERSQWLTGQTFWVNGGYYSR